MNTVDKLLEEYREFLNKVEAQTAEMTEHDRRELLDRLSREHHPVQVIPE